MSNDKTNSSNKKRVGILGWWYGGNYGSMLTYYALRKIVMDLGYDVLMLNESYGYPEGRGIFKAKYLQFVFADKQGYQYTNQAHYSDNYKYNYLCDIFLVGSDQMWNTYISRVNGDCFLDFVHPNKSRISYGTSFGSNLDMEFSLENIAELKKFDAVSVRENYCVDIAKKYFSIEAQQVLDPVFLPDVSSYTELADQSEKKYSEPYLLAFILDANSSKREKIKEIAQSLGINDIKVISEPSEESINNAHTHMSSFSILDDHSVENFLYAIKNATYIVTDSFHGTCFSYLFKKNFSVIFNHQRGTKRFEYLLGLLGLQNRQIMDEDNRMDLSSIDYESLKNDVEEKRKHSLEWLKGALNENKKPYRGQQSLVSKKNEAYYVCPKNLCTGCGACDNACPTKAIIMADDNEGFPYPQIRQELCIECGKCIRVCPVLHPSEKVQQNALPQNIYAAYSLDEETRFMSTSGGAFSEFAKTILAKGGAVYGAAYDADFNIIHTRITRIEDLPQLRQSKYYQSLIGDTFKKILHDLNEGRHVLFCGAPCQCAGLDNYLGGNANYKYPKLLILDFICHSVPSKKAFFAYLSELEEKYGGKAKRVWFKNKQTGWHNFSLRIDFEGRENYYIRTVGQDDFFKGFLKHKLFMRPACHDCKFKECRRAADVTLADFWQLKWNNADNNDNQEQGVSIIMTHTEKGQKTFDNDVGKKMFTETHTLEDVLKGNGGMKYSVQSGSYRDFFFEKVGKLKYSNILRIIEAEEEEINNNAKKIAAQPQIIGKVTKIGNVLIDMRPGSKLIVDEGGELVCNFNLTNGSNKECEIILFDNAVLHIKGKLLLCADSVIKVFNGGNLTIGGGFINRRAYISVSRKSEIGSDFLCGTDVYLLDTDAHHIIDLETNKIINTNQTGFKIGNHVWFGNQVEVMANVNIGNGSIIGARALVTKSIPENSLAVGSPAKVIKTNVSWRN